VDLVCQVSLDLKVLQEIKEQMETLDVLVCQEILVCQVTEDHLEHLD
jgi:hypothetical protein